MITWVTQSQIPQSEQPTIWIHNFDFLTFLVIKYAANGHDWIHADPHGTLKNRPLFLWQLHYINKTSTCQKWHSKSEAHTEWLQMST